MEGPEAGVYYRGVCEIKNNKVEITLPKYVDSLATDFTVHLTHIDDITDENKIGQFVQLKYGNIKNGKFIVYSTGPCKFSWLVFGKRSNIKTEPYKESVVVKGEGPYKYIMC